RRVVVGVNAFTEGNDDASMEILRITAEQEQTQIKRLGAVKADRDSDAVARALDEVRRVADDAEANLMPTLIDAVRTMATEGEVMAALADVFGTYTETPVI
ncbi:MAG: methylmalonyl-CoA mutase, partial [Acidimicrobiales bacterium]|nr:methylmalonyl-CoA mutase [Acidimicrobiales bacterium]